MLAGCALNKCQCDMSQMWLVFRVLVLHVSCCLSLLFNGCAFFLSLLCFEKVQSRASVRDRRLGNMDASQNGNAPEDTCFLMLSLLGKSAAAPRGSLELDPNPGQIPRLRAYKAHAYCMIETLARYLARATFTNVIPMAQEIDLFWRDSVCSRLTSYAYIPKPTPTNSSLLSPG